VSLVLAPAYLPASLLVVELFLARLQLVDVGLLGGGELVLDALEVLLGQLVFHFEEGFLLLLPRNPGDELGVAGP